jgi:transposase
MSLRSPRNYPIPEETVRVATAAFPKGNPYMDMHAELGLIYTNAQFASLFSSTGQPAEDPARLALILVMQFLEGLSDRQAADAVRARIDWKYALALELTDAGFDASVLSEFRQRLITGATEALLLDTLLTRLHERGLLKARGIQRTDSTQILAAVRTINRLELVIETMRYTLNRLAVAAPTWLRLQVQPAWLERYELRAENSRLPKADAARRALASQVGADGYALLAAVYAPDTPAVVRQERAVEVLRQVWLQQFYGPDDPPRWRSDRDAPTAGQLIHSPYDLEARYSIKRGQAWLGYKVHFTETCDAERPHVITHVATTAATVPDDMLLPDIHAALAAKALLPTEHLVDCGYTNADNLFRSQQQYGIRVIGPVADDPSWQARASEGFAKANFVIDWERQVVTCPAGKQSYSWLPNIDATKVGTFQVRFSRADCSPCPSRTHCTRAKVEPRIVFLQAREQHEILHTTRQHQHTEAFHTEYALRAGVESLMSQGMRAFDLRKSRYIGQARTQLQHILTAVAINLVRLAAWWQNPQPTPARRSAFARLMAPI